MSIDAELKEHLDQFPVLDLTDESLVEIRTELNAQSLEAVSKIEGFDHLSIADRFVPNPWSDQSLRLRIYSPPITNGQTPCLLWIHGGGYILGCPEMDELMLCRLVDYVGCTVVAPDYRLAPEHPYPDACNDCRRTLDWLLDNKDELSIRTDDLAVGGASAGAGLAASLVLSCRDRQNNPAKFQCLIYPMLDHRNVEEDSDRAAPYEVWTRENNRFAWNAYLGGNSVTRATSALESPVRARLLHDLPATYMCVGDQDLFYDESKDYARRLSEAGVPLEFHVIRGAIHGFDMFAVTIAEEELARRFRILLRHFGQK